jgi:hypothetical protein
LDIGTAQNLRAITKRADGSLRIRRWWGSVVTMRGVGEDAVGTTEVSDPALLVGVEFDRRCDVCRRTWLARSTGAMAPRGHRCVCPERMTCTASAAAARRCRRRRRHGSILRFDGNVWRKESSPSSRLLRAVWRAVRDKR